MAVQEYGALSSFKTFLESLYGAGVKKVWFGTEAEWTALSDDEKSRFDIACLYEE